MVHAKLDLFKFPMRLLRRLAKFKTATIVALLFNVTSHCAAADTCATNSFRMKAGIKVSAEKSGAMLYAPDLNHVYNFGGQFIVKLRNKVSLETGLYYLSRVFGDGADRIYYRNLSIPLNLRADLCWFFVSAGVYGDYLVAVNTFTQRNDPLYQKRKVNAGYNICFGIQQQILTNWTVFLEGRYFNSIRFPFVGNSVGFLNYGLGIGINRKF
jgi:hypothetical protein